MLSFDIEEFDMPEEYGRSISFEEKIAEGPVGEGVPRQGAQPVACDDGVPSRVAVAHRRRQRHRLDGAAFDAEERGETRP